MRSLPASRQTPPTRIQPVLNDFIGECRAIAVPMLAYIGVLALLAIGSRFLWDGLELEAPTAPAGWSQTQRAKPPLPQNLELRGTL